MLFHCITSGDEHPPTVQIREKFLQQVKQVLVTDRVIVSLYTFQVINYQKQWPRRIESDNGLLNLCFCAQFRIWQGLFEKARFSQLFEKLVDTLQKQIDALVASTTERKGRYV